MEAFHKRTSFRPIFEIAPITNFYFYPEPSRPLSAHDREFLPPLKKMISSHSSEDFLGGIRDGSLFDTAGNKVWWGESAEGDIKRITGPLYLLSQQDSYHGVPDWIALTDREVSMNPQQAFFAGTEFSATSYLKRETTTLLCGYIRLKAVGK
jgi:hypothetical protein